MGEGEGKKVTKRTERIGSKNGIRLRAARRRGVTFIEIMTVLVILSLLALMAAPTLKGYYKRNQLKAAAREFVALARYARQAAILRNHPTELHIDFKNDAYWLVLEPGKKSDFRGSRDRPSDEMEEKRSFDSRRQRIYFRTVESATDPFGAEQIVEIRFFKDGSASASTIVLAGENDRMVTIEIAGATGAVRTYAGPPQQAAATPPTAGLKGEGARS